MQSGVTAYDLLLSYPSDLSDCTPLIKAAVSEFNNHFGRDHDIVVRPIHWREDAFPTLGEAAQSAINGQIADQCDLILAAFWTRFGSPTEGYGSGTQEEVSRAMNSGRQVFLYFLDRLVPPSAIDTEQLDRVKAFRASIGASGLYATVVDEAGLASDFRQKLELYFTKVLTSDLGKRLLSSAATPRRILWVDDKPENNTAIRQLLEGYGIECSLALSTRQADLLLKTSGYDLIVSDMGRREGPREGYVLLDMIRAQGNTTPFIIFAGSSDPQHVLETQQHGGQGCTNMTTELVDMIFMTLLGGSGAPIG